MAFFSEELAWSADWQPTYDGDAPMPMPLLQGDPYHSDGPDAMRGVVMDSAPRVAGVCSEAVGHIWVRVSGRRFPFAPLCTCKDT